MASSSSGSLIFNRSLKRRPLLTIRYVKIFNIEFLCRFCLGSVPAVLRSAKLVTSPLATVTSGLDEFVRSIHSNARGVRPVWLAAAASFRRALGPRGPGEEPAAGAGQLAAGAALRDPPR